MKRKSLNNRNHKKNILKLRAEGKTYNEISKELGCSKSLISYHCGNGNEKKRCLLRNKTRQVLARKISSFRCRVPRKILTNKLKGFRRHEKGVRYKKKSKVNNISKDYTTQDVVNKISNNPVCYLTGKTIDLNNGSSYHLDHIIPTAQGGTNDLNNLGICTAGANQAKGALSLNELYKLCESILAWRDKDK